jgi:hypothetical protein
MKVRRANEQCIGQHRCGLQMNHLHRHILCTTSISVIIIEIKRCWIMTQAAFVTRATSKSSMRIAGNPCVLVSTSIRQLKKHPSTLWPHNLEHLVPIVPSSAVSERMLCHVVWSPSWPTPNLHRLEPVTLLGDPNTGNRVWGRFSIRRRTVSGQFMCSMYQS